MITLENDELSFHFPEVHGEAQCSIEFQHTLRIPDDEKTYPLPPGLLGDHPLAEHRFIESEVEAWIEARVVERDALAAEPPRPQKRGRGRPKGSKNKAITTEKPKPKRDQRSIARKIAEGDLPLGWPVQRTPAKRED